MSNIMNRIDKRFTRDDGKKDYCTCAPDVLFGLDIGEACRLHDWRIEGQRVKSRALADTLFKENILLISRLEKKPLRGAVVAYSYYLGVRLYVNLSKILHLAVTDWDYSETKLQEDKQK